MAEFPAQTIVGVVPLIIYERLEALARQSAEVVEDCGGRAAY